MVFDPSLQLATAGRVLTANEQWFDALVRHQIGILRLAGSIRNDILEILDVTETDMRLQINEAARKGIGFTSASRISRLNNLVTKLSLIRAESWGKVETVWSRELTALAQKEPLIVDGLLKTTMPVDLTTRLPSARLLRDLVASRPFEGKTLSEWAKDIEAKDIARIDSQIKIGLTQGETGKQIARRVVGRVSLRGRDGVLEITRKDADGITRTATNAIANFSRREYYKENASLFTKELYVATLDFRTTHQCADLDGRQFPIGEGPIPPVHFNCRSLRVAIVDGEAIGERPARSFTQRQLLREFTAQNDLGSVTRRADLPRGTKQSFDSFARKRKRELTGRVPAKLPYQEFLERQSVMFQNDYLGTTKGQLFRVGVPLEAFVDPAGRPIRLDRLARTSADAFRAAGLDPEDFL